MLASVCDTTPCSLWIMPTFLMCVLPPSSGRSPLWLRQCALLKRRYTSTRLHCAISSLMSWHSIEEHGASVNVFHLTRFDDSAVTSPHVLPWCPISSYTVLFHCVLGRRLLRASCGFQTLYPNWSHFRHIEWFIVTRSRWSLAARYEAQAWRLDAETVGLNPV
jgi:hypothetical protein